MKRFNDNIFFVSFMVFLFLAFGSFIFILNIGRGNIEINSFTPVVYFCNDVFDFPFRDYVMYSSNEFFIKYEYAIFYALYILHCLLYAFVLERVVYLVGIIRRHRLS